MKQAENVYNWDQWINKEKTYKLYSNHGCPMALNEDNPTYIAQVKGGYIKDLLTESLPTATFKRLAQKNWRYMIDIKEAKIMFTWGGDNYAPHSFYP